MEYLVRDNRHRKLTLSTQESAEALVDERRRAESQGVLNTNEREGQPQQDFKKVKSNKGTPGVDGMIIDEILSWLKEHNHELVDRVKRGKYTPKQVRRVEIPKPDGGMQKLGIPTVTGRTIQGHGTTNNAAL